VSVFGNGAGPAAAGDGCPCGVAAAYGDCCGRLHRGEREAETASELMRSRYAAYVVRDDGYLLRTWHPRTRPEAIGFDSSPEWTGLTVLGTADGRYTDNVGEVEFEAAYAGGVLHERSRFQRRAGHWVYVDGVVLD
jgi:SEC-C motif-containing protein